MADVFITGGVRTFIGVKGKAYRTVPAEDLAAPLLALLHTRNQAAGVPTELVIGGSCVAGGGNITRLALLKAGLPPAIPALTVDAQCVSGLESVIAAYARIKSGVNAAILAGGAESVSTQCVRSYSQNHPNHAYCLGHPSAFPSGAVYATAQATPDLLGDDAMLIGADETCRANGITGEDMLPFAVQSHERAAQAAQDGILAPYILPVHGATCDEGIRPAMSAAFARRLPPLLPQGIVTAATSCLFNDGAAFVSVCNEACAQAAAGAVFRIAGVATAAADGRRSPEAVLAALSVLLQKSGVPKERVERIDYNQAFACIDVLYRRHYDAPSNAFGGALAYGHPYAATGGVLLLHLMRAMEAHKERFGAVAIPAAGGIASAILLERM